MNADGFARRYPMLHRSLHRLAYRWLVLVTPDACAPWFELTAMSNKEGTLVDMSVMS